VKEATLKSRLTACAAIFLSSLVFYCNEVLAQCSLNIQNRISSGWNKDGVSYTVQKNTLKIKVAEGGGDDADSIYLGSIKDCRTLTINVSQISGKYSWGGKVIGFSFFNDKLEPSQWGNQASFPTPRGYSIEDGFIKAELLDNAKLVYDIANKDGTTHIGAKVFIGSNNAVELQFSTQEASPALQMSARQPPRSYKRYTAYTAHQSDSSAISCSLNCHEPRTGHNEFVFTRDFSLPPRAACPDESD
jgi:hypothetical protein